MSLIREGMRGTLRTVSVTMACLLIGGCNVNQAKSEGYQVHILLYGAHPLLNLTADGIKAGITRKNSKAVVTIHDASFQQTAVVTQTQHIMATNPDAFIVLGTPAVIGSLPRIPRTTPVFFGASSAPAELKIFPDNDPRTWGNGSKFVQPQSNVYGFVTRFDFDLTADLIQAVSAKIGRGRTPIVVGYPFNASEQNSDAAGKAIEAALPKPKFRFVRAPVAAPSDVPRATRQLVGNRVDIIQIGPDNTVVGGFGAVAANAPRGVPILTTEAATVRSGATAAAGIDFRGLGEALGEWVIAHLDGEAAGPAIRIYADQKLFVNNRQAQSIIGQDYQRFFDDFAKAHSVTLVSE